MNSRAFQILNDIKAEGLVEGYAVGGAVATMLHTGVGAPWEMDVFVSMAKKLGVLVSMRDFPQRLVDSGAMPTYFPPPGSRPYTDNPRFVGPDPTSPITDYLRSRGYPLVSERVIIEGVPTRFTPTDKLEEEAIKKARTLTWSGVPVRVVTPEYLIPILVRSGKSTEQSQALNLLAQTTVNRRTLARVLRRYKLLERFEALSDFLKARA